MIRQDVDVSDISAWLENYNERLRALDRPLKKHQINGLVEFVERLRPAYERWQEHLGKKPEETAYKYIQKNWHDELEEIREEMGWLMAWNMGLGKTAVALIVLEIIHHFFPKIVEDRVPAIAIVPNTIKEVWAKEIEKWCLDRSLLDFTIVPSGEREATIWITVSQVIRPFLVITSYDTVRLRYEQLRQLQYGVIILDEVHYIKNHEAQRTRGVYYLDANLRIALSGTPITNRPNDWHSSLVALQGTTRLQKNKNGKEHPIKESVRWGSYAGFINDYCLTGRSAEHIIGGRNLTNRGCRLCEQGCASRCRRFLYSRFNCVDCKEPIALACQSCNEPLHPKAKHFVMNRLAGGDDGLEPYQTVTRNHQFTEIQQKYYDKIKEGLVEWLEKDHGGWQKGEFTVANVLAQLTYFLEASVDLRQLAYSIKNKTGGDNIIALTGLSGRDILGTHKDVSGKLDELKEMLDEDIDIKGKDKIVIFTRFRLTAHLLKEELKEYGALVIDSESNRQGKTHAYVELFQSSPQHRIIITTSAGFEGITLTAANWVILYGVIDWTPAKIDQAIHRAWRIGQKRTLTVVKLLAPGLETNLQTKLAEKQADFDAAIDGGTISRMGLFASKEEILALV